ncbi:MAG: hypothetical protein CMJ46_16540 [Planctomyces sp.]|nr:hypothetical protein [Planctomyces sp.]
MSTSSGSSKSRLIIWTIVGLGVVGVLVYDQYNQGNLDPLLEMVGLGDKPAPAAKSKKPESKPKQSETTAESETVAESKPTEGTATVETNPPAEPAPEKPAVEEKTVATVSTGEEATATDAAETATGATPVPDPQSTEVTGTEAEPVDESTPAVVEEEIVATESDQTKPEATVPEQNASPADATPVIAEPKETAETEAAPFEQPVATTGSQTQSNEEETTPQSALEQLTNSTRPDSGAKSPRATSDAPIPTKVYSYAHRIVRKYDLDRSTQLEPAEYNNLKDRDTFVGADNNGDLIISSDELAQYIANYGENRRIRLLSPYGGSEEDETTSPTTSPAGAASSTSSNRTTPATTGAEEMTPEQKELERRRGLKYSVKSSRLPDGLPPWFLTLDKDGDAQLTVSEFAPDASQLKVEEFRKLDLNRDGLMTPAEYQRASKENASKTANSAP